MYDPPLHQKNWLQNIRPSPAKRRQQKRTVTQIEKMEVLQIISGIYAGEIEVSQQVFDIFVTKAKQQPEGEIKQHLRKQAATIFKDYLS